MLIGSHPDTIRDTAANKRSKFYGDLKSKSSMMIIEICEAEAQIWESMVAIGLPYNLLMADISYIPITNERIGISYEILRLL